MSKASSPVQILYGELNEEVLSSGAADLQKAGFSVKTAVGRKGVLEAVNQARFDLVILGATLSRDDRHHLVYMAKKTNKATKVFVMHTDGSRHPYVDGNTDTGENMEYVLRKIAPPQAKAAAASAGR